MEYEPVPLDTTFEAARSGGLVVVSGMRVWLVCEHPLLPFYCDISVGYVVREWVVGWSKFARIAHSSAHRLQLQEGITREAADVIVLVSGVHTLIGNYAIESVFVLSLDAVFADCRK